MNFRGLVLTVCMLHPLMTLSSKEQCHLHLRRGFIKSLFKQCLLFLMYWSSNDTECSQLGLQASSNHFWKSAYCFQWVLDGTIFQTFFVHFKIIFLTSAFAVFSFCCLIFFLSFPFLQMLFVYNFILTTSCYPRHLSPGIPFLSTLPAFFYLLSDLLGSYLYLACQQTLNLILQK